MKKFIIIALSLILSFNLIAAKPKVITSKTGIKLALIPGGYFVMGNKKGKPNASYEHKVYVDSFYMAIYETTQKSYEKIIGNNPSKFGGMANPVDQVRWYEAAKYCNELSKREGLTPVYNEKTWEANFNANGYRLPTEAEWEYAASAGGKKKEIKKSKITYFAWYQKNADDKSHPVGKKLPNGFGLYDMLGNLSEWCNDWYSDTFYKKSPVKNPKGPTFPIIKKKVIRGGSWYDRIKKISVTYRQFDDPANADICQGYAYYGFRIVRKVK